MAGKKQMEREGKAPKSKSRNPATPSLEGYQKVIFIPDAHLKQPGDENYRAMCAFLSGLDSKDCDALVIMGDFFDFWVGYRSVVPRRYLPLLMRLSDLSRVGIKIHYTEGNHDFVIGEYFAELLDAAVHPGPWELRAGGLRIYVAHGDQIDNADRGYHVFRWALRHYPIRLLSDILPAYIVEGIGNRMSGASRKRSIGRRKIDGEVVRRFLRARFYESYDAVVFGHFHKLELDYETFGGKKRASVSVGRWMGGRYDYVALEGGNFTAKSYAFKDDESRP